VVEEYKSENPETHRDYSDNPPTPNEMLEWVHTWLTQPNRERSKFTDIALVILTLIIAGAALWSAFIFQGQLDVARDVAVASERAWIGLDVPVTLEVIAPHGARVSIKGRYSVKNFGRGPATKVMSQFGNFVDPTNRTIADATANSSCDGPVKFTTGTVPVAGDLKQPPPFGYMLFPNQWHNEVIDYQGPVETVRFLRFVGCVAYLDQFRAVHWTRFCMERKPGDQTPIPALTFCALYNDTDQDQTK
jgi:hypothetical protein